MTTRTAKANAVAFLSVIPARICCCISARHCYRRTTSRSLLGMTTRTAKATAVAFLSVIPARICCCISARHCHRRITSRSPFGDDNQNSKSECSCFSFCHSRQGICFPLFRPAATRTEESAGSSAIRNKSQARTRSTQSGQAAQLSTYPPSVSRCRAGRRTLPLPTR